MKPFFYSHESKYYHLSGKCSEANWPDTNLEQSWCLSKSFLKNVYNKFKLQTHAFVLMRNHFHWLCSFQKESTTDALTLKSVSINFPLECQVHSVIVDHIESYRNTYAYIYRNPVSAGLVDKSLDYPYSTLPYLLGVSKEALDFPLFDNMGLIQNSHKILNLIDCQFTQISAQYKYGILR